MEIHSEPLLDVDRYLSNEKMGQFEHYRPFLENCLRSIEKFKPLTPETKILEVGTGRGFFPLVCGLRGLRCDGLEISPQLAKRAVELGREHGLDLNVQLANIEEADLGENVYDVVMASSVFEHVERWRTGLRNVYRILKPGGVMYFESTNKFSIGSGEYPKFPLYGWFPDKVRYGFRKIVHGPDIMKLGIDFHQFRYPLLRREFRKIGFRQIHDLVDLSDPDHVSASWKKSIVNLSKTNALARHAALTFAEVTRFVCVK